MRFHDGPPGTWPDGGARTPHPESGATDTDTTKVPDATDKPSARARQRQRFEQRSVTRTLDVRLGLRRPPGDHDPEAWAEAGRTTWAHFAASGAFTDAGPFAEVIEHTLAAPFGACGCERCSGGRAVA